MLCGHCQKVTYRGGCLPTSIAEVSFSFVWREEADCFVFPCLIWKNFHVESLLKVVDIGNEFLVARFTLVWVTTRPAQVIDCDVRLVDNE